MSELVTLRYRAFLSHAPADTRMAGWLRREPERYLVDRDLVGRVTSQGPVPARLRLIYAAGAAGDSLTDAAIAALNELASLVVCAPRPPSCDRPSATRRGCSGGVIQSGP